jgi:putative DNA primase/helicase
VDGNSSHTLRRVDPSEIQEFLESIEVALTPMPTVTAPATANGFALDPNAVAPAAKLEKLLMRNAKFRRTWERNRGAELSSQSEYDMALAALARHAKWSDQEIVDLLVQHRREGGDTEKIGRHDYYVLTLAKVAAKPNEQPRATARAQVVPANGRTEFNLTDAGNAERLVSIHGSDILCLGDSWHRWDGKRFGADELRSMDALAIHVARTIFERAEALEAEAERLEKEPTGASDSAEAERLRDLATEMKSWARRSEARRGIEATIAVARHMRAVRGDDLDADPMLLNCENGTLDLRLARLRPHRREDRLTKLAPTLFDPSARSAALDRFLDDLTCGDLHLRAWLGKLLGYSLAGVRNEDIVPILVGGGGSGKSTLFEALVAMLGDYAITIPFDAFVERGHRGGPRPELAMCRGARVVLAAEVSEGAKLDSAVLKSVTGGERITPRMLYENPITFTPQFVPLLACNVAPRLANDSGNRRRLRIIPCDNEVKDPDRSLRAELCKLEPRAALLAFVVDGYRRWQAEGLGTCEAVDEATARYWEGHKSREQERSSKETRASVEAFVGACVEVVEGVVTPSSVLYAAFLEYCAREGITAPIDSVFGRALGSLGLHSKRTNSARLWQAVRLRDFSEGGDR